MDPAAPAPEPETAPPPPKPRSRWRRGLAWGLGGTVVVLGLLALLLPTILSSEFARARVEQAASDAAGRRVTMAGLSVDWGAAAVRDLVVRYGPAEAAPVLLRVREVRVPAGISAAFASRKEAAPVEILGPELRIDLREIARDRPGTAAATAPAPPAAPGAAKGPPEPVPPFRVEVVVKEGSIVLVDGTGKETRLGTFSAKVTASDDGPAALLFEADLGAAGRLRVEGGATPFQSGLPVDPVDLAGTLKVTLQSLDLAALHAAAAATPDLGVEELRGVIEGSIEARTIAGAGSVEGTASLEVRDLVAAGPGLGGRVEEPTISASASFRAGRDGSMDLREASLRLPHLVVKGTATVAPDARPTGSLSVEGRLGAVASRAVRLGLLPPEASMAGDFILQARSMADATGQRVSGSLSVREAQFAPGKNRAPIDEPAIEASFDVGMMEGGGFRVHEATLKSGSALARVEGFADRGGAADLRLTATLQVARLSRIATGMGAPLPGDLAGIAEVAGSVKRGAAAGPDDRAHFSVTLLDLVVTPPGQGATPVKDPKLTLSLDAVPGREWWDVKSLVLLGTGAEVRASGRVSADGSSGSFTTEKAEFDLARVDAIARAFGAAPPGRVSGSAAWKGPVSWEKGGALAAVEKGEAVLTGLVVEMPAAGGAPARTLREGRVLLRVDAASTERDGGRAVVVRAIRLEAEGVEVDGSGALAPDGSFEGTASGRVALASVSARAAAFGILAKDPAPRGSIEFDAGVRGKPGDEAVSLRRLEAVDADITLSGSGSASRKGPADLEIEFGADLSVLADCTDRAGVEALPKGAAGKVAIKAEVKAVTAQAPLAATVAASVEGLSFPDAGGGPAWTQKRIAFDGKAAFDRTVEVLTGEGTLASDDGTARVSGRAVLGGGAPKRFEGKAVVDLDLGGLFRSRPDLLPLEGMVLGRAKGTVAAEGPMGEGAAAKAEGAARLVVDSIRTEPLTLTAAELDAGLKGGVVEVRSLKGTVNGGEVTGKATLGVSGDALRHSLEVRAKGVRVDPAMAFLLKRVVPIFAIGEKGGVSGLLDASLSLEGGGASWEEAKGSLRGKGRLRVSEGSVSGSGILANVLELFGGGQALPFAAIETEFTVRDRAVWSERIGVDGRDHAMVLKGSTGFDGKLDYRVGAKALKLGKKKTERLKPLLDEEGNLPFTLGGTLWKPRVKPPDLGKVAGNALEDAAKKKLKELLGGDDE